MRNLVRIFLAGSLLPILVIAPPNAAALAVTSSNADATGLCTQAVDNTGSITVNRFGNECVVIFKRVGTTSWTIPSGVTKISTLIIAGGGGGGFDVAGGGGAGGLLYYGGENPKTPNGDSLTVTSGNISVVVGGGGSGANSTQVTTRGDNGGNSSITLPSTNSYTAIGGGGGNSRNIISTAQSGGSGGGGGYGGGTPTAGGAGTSGQGRDGGRISSGSSGGGGGGGGAGTVGGNWSDGVTDTGAGGSGLSYSISGTANYYAGGGGGGSWNAKGGAGGVGGGGDGGSMNSSTCRSNCSTDALARTGNAGGANTGGGGGGSGNADGGSPAGNGGSGIVVIRYLADSTAPTITGPSNSTGASSSISIYESATAIHTYTANESVTWVKSGADEAFFTLSLNGVLSISSRDFESPQDSGLNNTYVVVITATDSAGNMTSQTTTVTILNLNEAPTISTSGSAATYALAKNENSLSIETFTAFDVDVASNLTWSISGADSALFAIGTTSGALNFISAPDFEDPQDSGINNGYLVIITVSDGALIDTQTLTVTITNLNESGSVSAPSISGTAYKGVAITVTVTINSPGKVRFFVGGKRIANCLARSTTGNYPLFTATCSWKPSNFGAQLVSAQLAPSNNTFTNATSAKASIWVFRKSGTRN